jgi:hypothetical protein
VMILFRGQAIVILVDTTQGVYPNVRVFVLVTTLIMAVYIIIKGKKKPH